MPDVNVKITKDVTRDKKARRDHMTLFRAALTEKIEIFRIIEWKLIGELIVVNVQVST